MTDSDRIEILKKTLRKVIDEKLNDVEEENEDYKQGVKDGLEVTYNMILAVEELNYDINVSFDGFKTSGGESDEPGTD